MWIDLPIAVTEALERFHAQGFSAFLVGGCVRDILRDVSPHDYDLTTSATPEEIKAVFRDKNVVETGIKHGTVTVFSHHTPLEITTFRKDGAYSDGRHPDRVSFSSSIKDDLARRDFTVNAMAWSPETGVVDLFGGQEDLRRGIIRCVGEPSLRFGEDALRILRGIRFASQLQFSVEAKTASAMRDCTPLLKQVSAERIAEEFVRLLCGAGVENTLTEYRDIIAFFIPEVKASFAFDQRTPHHCYDVYTHTAKVVATVPPVPLLRLAAFFHDVGKPSAVTLIDGRARFKGHPAVSAAIAETVMKRLRMAKKLTLQTVCLIREHDTLLKKTSDASVLRLLQRVPADLVEPLLALMRGDACAKADPAVALQRVQESEKQIRRLLASSPCLSVADLAITGNDLLAVGCPSGEAMGVLMRRLLDAVTDGHLPNRREDLLAYAEKNSEKSAHAVPKLIDKRKKI